MADLLFLIPLLPLVAFVVNILAGRGTIRDRAHWVAAPAVFGSWLLSIFVLLDLAANEEPLRQHLFTWIPAGEFTVEVNLFAAQLTAVMLLVVTTVGFLVHVYSVGYMHGDGGYYRFFSYLPLFVFSMLMLVLADDYLLMFVFWEAVGLCSYFLIGFWFKRRSAANAARKAFIVNRIGDLGFGLGIMLTFWSFGTLAFHGEEGVFARVGEVSGGTLTAIALLLFLGACGKSAQFPLHVWLPDAMEGPTPVSALIHAATMVTAGIYMVARSYTIFAASETAMLVVAIIGAFTAFMAATIALVQNDIKRIVAYSTLSQLGYMAFALGTGAWVAAIFHLMTHAFFKGLLFLGCGSVIHGMHEEQDIQKMGGLRKYLPITFWTFLIAALANAGLVPFAGFWSKDEIIVGGWISEHQPIGTIVAVVGLVSAFLTALYMFRLVFLTFFTEPRFDTEHVHPHESPRTMALPLVLLAIPAALIGFVGFPPEDGPLHHFLEPVFESEGIEPEGEEVAGGALAYAVDGGEVAAVSALVAQEEPAGGAEGETGPGAAGEEDHAEDEAAGATGEEHAAEDEHHVSLATTVTFGVISTLMAAGGIFLAYLIYIRKSISAVALGDRFQGLYRFLFDKWRFDELYDVLFVRPFQGMATFFWRVVDVGIIDATVNGVAIGIGAISQRLRHVQTGLVSNYALAIALGMVLLVGVYLTGFSNLFR
ncbi:MAG: NADH-quinone oxidoreductase subunit L [Chloroflexota bacterium]|nr:NADH-quinone oxidoreductase subunit L [Chloroflexota bacterium]